MRARLLLAPLAAALLAIPVAAHAQAKASTPAKAAAAAPTAPAAPTTMAVTETAPGLLKEARITPAEAERAVRRHVAHATITKAELEREHKRLIYSYDLTVPGRKGTTEVHVDARTGKVLSTVHENEAREAPAKPATSKPTTTPGTRKAAAAGPMPAAASKPAPAKKP